MCVREKYSLTQSWSNYDLICHDFSSILKETSGSHYGLLCRNSLVPVRYHSYLVRQILTSVAVGLLFLESKVTTGSGQ